MGMGHLLRRDAGIAAIPIGSPRVRQAEPRRVGLGNGRQFFVTTPFDPMAGDESVALYLFDAAGKLLEARIDALGPRAALDAERQHAVLAARLRELGMRSSSFSMCPISCVAVG
jgi:hypothetical protein